ncbi:MAG TPA: hypothetical protein VF790_00715 [Dissulfurispiraceae bacterium]
MKRALYLFAAVCAVMLAGCGQQGKAPEGKQADKVDLIDKEVLRNAEKAQKGDTRVLRESEKKALEIVGHPERK